MPDRLSASSRRQFLKTAAAAVAAAQTTASLHASLVRPFLAGTAAAVSAVQPLDAGWEYYEGPLASPWEVWRGDEIAAWEKVTSPHCFNHYDACDPDTPYYRGHGWYRQRVPIENPIENGRTLLYFEGAGQTSQVFVGDTLVGTHVGGYDEFVYDITDALKAAATSKTLTATNKDGVALSVLCDNAQDLDRSPSDLSDFSLYGGLYRHVHLIYAPAVSIEAVHFVTKVDLGHESNVSVRVRLYNPTKFAGDVHCFIRVTSPDGQTQTAQLGPSVAWEGEREIAGFATNGPLLWSPDHPNLYTYEIKMTTELGECTVTERFGLRHTEWVDHGPFKLNGEQLVLRGTQRHVDHAGYAAAQPDNLVRQELELVKAMGANFIRLGHYQQPRLVLDICDEIGLLVWEEAPWCRSGVVSEKWKQQTRGMLAHMIDQHFNHPSIIMWGLGNEDDWPTEYPSIDKAAIRSFMQEMHDLAHSLDSSRVTCIRRCDFARDIPDVYSPSIWNGWYSGIYTDYEAAITRARDTVKHLIHIEWGADSHAGRHSEMPDAEIARAANEMDPKQRSRDLNGLDFVPASESFKIPTSANWTETYACNLFDWILKTQETLRWMTGSAQWCFKDFTTPLRAENPVPRINQKGLLERDMTRKEGYYVFQSYWSSEPMAHLYGHSWPVRWGDAGEERMVKAYSNCASAELFLNGKTQGMRQRDSQNFPAAGLRWMVKFTAGKNHLRLVAHQGETIVTDEIELTYQTQKWGKPAKLKIVELKRDNETATVEALLTDAKGVLCLDATNVVRFTLAGGGKLIDNMGTTNGSRVVQLYNGRARISMARRDSASTVSVMSEGIAPAFVHIV